MRQVVRIDVRGSQMFGQFPDRVMARGEHRAAALQHRNAVVGRERTRRRPLHSPRGPCRCAAGSFKQRIVGEFVAGQFGELVLVPCRLIIQCKLRRSMRRRDAEEIRMFERPDLGVHRIAHQVQPGAGDCRVVPHLLRTAFVADHLGQRLVIPLRGFVQDHRNGLEVAAARGFGQALRQFVQRAGAVRDQAGLGRLRLARAQHAGRARCQAQSDPLQCSPASVAGCHCIPPCFGATSGAHLRVAGYRCTSGRTSV